MANVHSGSQFEHEDSIAIVVFRKQRHMPALLDMLNDLGLPAIKSKELPKIGFIAQLHKQPIAFGFLRKVEGGIAQMDTVLSNPLYGKIIKESGTNKVIEYLLLEAKHLQIHTIIAFLTDTSVISKAEDSGFKVVKQQVFVLRK